MNKKPSKAYIYKTELVICSTTSIPHKSLTLEVAMVYRKLEIQKGQLQPTLIHDYNLYKKAVCNSVRRHDTQTWVCYFFKPLYPIRILSKNMHTCADRLKIPLDSWPALRRGQQQGIPSLPYKLALIGAITTNAEGIKNRVCVIKALSLPTTFTSGCSSEPSFVLCQS